jgi:di/tricarboxylate transporter
MRPWAGLAAALLLPLGILALPMLTWTTRGTLAIVLSAAILWAVASAYVPPPLTGLAVLVALVLARLLPFTTALAAAAEPAAWLIVAGMMLGAAVEHSALARHVATVAVRMARAGTGNAPSAPETVSLRAVAPLYAAAAAVGAVATLAIPSGVVRVFLLGPVAHALVARAGGHLDDSDSDVSDPRLGTTTSSAALTTASAPVTGSSPVPHPTAGPGCAGTHTPRSQLPPAVQEGLVLAVLLGTLAPSAGILTAATPNLVVVTALEAAGQPAPAWATWAYELALVAYLGPAVLVPLVLLLLLGCGLRRTGQHEAAATKMEAGREMMPTADTLRTPLLCDSTATQNEENDHSSLMAADASMDAASPAPSVSAPTAPGGVAAPPPPSPLLPLPPPPWPAIKMAVLLVACVGLWATDAYHGVPPTDVALAAALLAYLPAPIGIAPFTLVRTHVNWPVLLYFVAIVAIGTAVQADPTLAAWLNTALTAWLGLGGTSVFLRYWLCALAAIPLNVVLESAATAAVLTPPLLAAAPAAGLAPMQAGMLVAVATNAVWLPYQSAPWALAYAQQAGRVRLRMAIMASGLVSLCTFAVLVPLLLLWWMRVTLPAADAT